MNKQNLKNEELERLGRTLLEAGKASGAEIEKIVGSPELFDSIKARIRAEQSRRQAKSFFGGWMFFSIWTWRKSVAAVSVFAVCLTLALGWMFFKKPDARISLTNEEVRAKTNFQNPPDEIITSPEIAETSFSGGKNRIGAGKRLKRGGQFTTKNSAASSARNRNSLERRNDSPTNAGEKFYPVMLAGDLEENAEELHVYRVELQASSLWALGINLPVENESALVKTDLLVGADGVTRAVRLVK